MKKTYKINIAGVIFTIDDDAFVKLQNYLTEINSHFSRQDGGKEIIADIESRIAELFQAGLSEKKEVITLDDVNEVIHIMGDPMEFIREDEAAGVGGQTDYVYESRRRLYRDPDNSVIGGVCGGLGAYFNIDPVWMRLVFIAAFFLQFGILVYIILWIVVPMARTTSQKLEMKGERVTVQNIERSVKEEFEKVKDNVRRIPETKTYRQAQSAAHTFAEHLGIAMVAILKMILVLVGVGLVIAGIALLIAIIGTLVYQFKWDPFTIEGWGTLTLPDFIGFFADPRNLPLILVCLFFTVIIPIFALIYGGIKLMFRIKTNDRVVGVTAFVLWIISTVSLVTLILIESKNFRQQGESSETVKFESYAYDTLYLQVPRSDALERYANDQWFFDEDLPFVYNEAEERLYGKMSLSIYKGDKTFPEFSLEKKARGLDHSNAQANVGEINYHWEMKDSLLRLDPYFSLPELRYWRGQDLNLTLYLPVGKVVYLDKDMEDFLDEAENTEGAWHHELVGKYWKMTEKGLAPIQ
jgi:phage shock protein PspC (stress-responsive transcriptional regulator)